MAELPGPGEQVGPYRLVRALGQGGMGVVYLAEQEQPIRRTVAMKLIKLGMDTREVIARFETEQQALALLDHPAIAHIYDAGATVHGRPYFAMEYVSGIPITAYCDTNQLTVRERLELFLQVCAGVQHAHQKGIIHRDLKPSNILVETEEGRPVPKIIDFGLAKALDPRMLEHPTFTRAGVLVGTPEYMSPEQAGMDRRAIDTRTDIYSLGVLLYELIVGVVPIDAAMLRGAAFDEICRIIQEQDPPRPSARLTNMGKAAEKLAACRKVDPRTLVTQVRGDLEWITGKALEKDPSRRYASASEFAADIALHLRSQPVSAGPQTVIYRARKFISRHRVGVLGAATALLGLIVAVSAITLLYLRSERERTSALRSQQLAERERQTAERNRAVADHQRTIAGQERAAAERQRTVADRLRAATEHNLGVARHQSYTANVDAAALNLRLFDPDEARRRLVLCPEGMRGWEWRHLFYRSNASLATLPAGGRFWEVPFRHALFAFSPDGKRVSWTTQNTLETWDAESLRHLSSDPSFGPTIFAITSDGARIASLKENEAFRVYETSSRRVLMTVGVDDVRITSAAFGPGGETIVLGLADGRLQQFDIGSQRKLFEVRGHEDAVRFIQFSPGGRSFVSVSGMSQLPNAPAAAKIWDALTGALKWAIQPGGSGRPSFTPAFNPGSVPDGRTVYIPVGEVVATYDTVSHREGREFPDSRGRIQSVVHGPDAILIAYVTDAGVLYVYGAGELRTAILTATSKDPLNSVAFSPDGKRIYTGSNSAIVRVWDVPTLGGTMLLKTTMQKVVPGVGWPLLRTIAAHPDGSRIFVGVLGKIEVLDAEDGRTLSSWSAHGAQVRSIAIAPTGRRIISGADDGTVRIWDDHGTAIATLGGHTARISAVAFDHSGTRIATGSLDGTARIWDGATLLQIAQINVGEQVNALALNPDGTQVATACGDPSRSTTEHDAVQVWDTASGRLVRSLPFDDERPRAPAPTVAFSPDGKWLTAARGLDGTLWVWDVRSGRLAAKRAAHVLEVTSLAFSPDGSRLVSGSRDRYIRVWSAQTWEPLLTLPGHIGAILGLTFTPDGSRILSFDDHSNVRIWDTRSHYTLKELTK